MCVNPKLNVVLCWHMHQPPYKDPLGGRYQASWTYLHAIKDYVDMVAHLEKVPDAKAVVNFTPVLLEQLQDYSQQLKRASEGRDQISDPLLAALAQPVQANSPEQRLAIVRHCLQADKQNVIQRFLPYQRLVELAEWVIEHPNGMAYINDQFLIDLVVWYHIAWLAEVERQQSRIIDKLVEQAHNFSLADRLELVTLLAEWVGSIIPRYRKLAETGQIELSTTPYAHPIIPLLLDFKSAKEAMPEVALPKCAGYPGGRQRALWHIEKAQHIFTQVFNQPASGVWPAEGGVCLNSLRLLGEAGFKWTASGQGVLNNSLAHRPLGSNELHTPYRFNGSPACFFRDDDLSDQIGFVYRHWHADDAVANLLHRLTEIANIDGASEHRVVSIILDGENAWEYYPHNGYYFLSALYKALVAEPLLHLTTFSDYLQNRKQPVPEHSKLSAGSWVYGNFATWIGDADKNRAWDMLCDAKQAFDAACQSGRLTEKEQAEAEQQLAYCEASDWFWWLGDHNPELSVAVFERLFRLHLSALYVKIKAHAPDYLARSFARGVAQGKVETMRPSK